MKCPHCNSPLKWDGIVRTSNPPKFAHKCPKCSTILYLDRIYVDSDTETYD